jgi:hypothetical protein
MNALTVLKQPALPVELNATPRAGGRLREVVNGTCEAGGPPGRASE